MLIDWRCPECGQYRHCPNGPVEAAKLELAQEAFREAVAKAKVRIRERRARWFKWFPWSISIVRR